MDRANPVTAVFAWVASHRKALVAYATALLTVLAVAVPHTSPWYAVVIAVAGALGVHGIPNRASTPKPAAAPTAPVTPPVKPPAG